MTHLEGVSPITLFSLLSLLYPRYLYAGVEFAATDGDDETMKNPVLSFECCVV